MINSPEVVRRRYNRLAPVYRIFEVLFALPPGIRAQAVAQLGLQPGDHVLEIGCGTGRNLPLLRQALGAGGRITGVDLSEGMLAQARRTCRRQGWDNVTLLRREATEYRLPEPVQGVLFSLSYAVIPPGHDQDALRYAWQWLGPGGRLVILDAKIPVSPLGRVLRPLATVASRATVLGSP